MEPTSVSLVSPDVPSVHSMSKLCSALSAQLSMEQISSSKERPASKPVRAVNTEELTIRNQLVCYATLHVRPATPPGHQPA